MSCRGIIWSSQEAEAVTGGVSTQDWHATGVSLNTGEVKPGDLFVAAKEDDLEQIFRKGAVAAMVSGGIDAGAEFPLLKVGSVFDALQDLARAARYRTHGTIISVQGRQARLCVADMLAKSAPVHEGGRHLSLGLANLPEDVEYGLFGASPAVHPDIAVITNCEAAKRDTLFETMPATGTVIINADSDDFFFVIARARAAGVRHIFTYGRHAEADARLCDFIRAGNGARLSLSIFGENYDTVLPARYNLDTSLLAGLLILKLTGKSLSPVLKSLEAPAAQKDGGDITLIDPALADKQGPQAVFRITNMIDLGFGRQTAVLDNISGTAQCTLNLPKKELAIPRSFSSLDFVYTSKKIGAVANAHEAIRARHSNAKIETIAPDVLTPGDFVVFKDVRHRTRAIFSEALRLVTGPKRKLKVNHAL